MTSEVDQTQASTDMMAASATFFEQTNEELKGTLSRLMGQLAPLSNTWKGLGAVQFTEIMAQYEKDMGLINGALLETAEAIRTSGTSYANSDAEAASRMTTIGGSHELPL